jgi:hypothetical protein
VYTCVRSKEQAPPPGVFTQNLHLYLLFPIGQYLEILLLQNQFFFSNDIQTRTEFYLSTRNENFGLIRRFLHGHTCLNAPVFHQLLNPVLKFPIHKITNYLEYLEPGSLGSTKKSNLINSAFSASTKLPSNFLTLGKRKLEDSHKMAGKIRVLFN